MRELAPHSHSKRHVKITIGIPAYNERERVSLLLQSLLKQVNHSVEIVVNTGGSTDGTSEEIAKLARSLQSSHMIRLITGEKRMGKAAALDDIVLRATGDIVVFIDADTMISKNSVNNLIKPFSEDEMTGMASGNVLSLNDGDDLFSFISRFQRELHHKLCLSLRRKNLPPKVNGTFFAVRRGVIKGFPRHVVSDDEYASWCAQSHGYSVVYVPEAIVYTKDPTTLKDYIVKRRRILGGHFQMKQLLDYTVPTTSIRTISTNLIRLALNRWRKMVQIAFMASLELLCRVLAHYDVVRDTLSPCYRVDSAKFTSEGVGDNQAR